MQRLHAVRYQVAALPVERESKSRDVNTTPMITRNHFMAAAFRRFGIQILLQSKKLLGHQILPPLKQYRALSGRVISGIECMRYLASWI